MLSPQEKKAISLILEGLSNREIGSRMGTSEACAKNYVCAAYRKLEISNVRQLFPLVIQASRENHTALLVAQ